MRIVSSFGKKKNLMYEKKIPKQISNQKIWLEYVAKLNCGTNVCNTYNFCVIIKINFQVISFQLCENVKVNVCVLYCGRCNQEIYCLGAA